jgi:hypothetical protein
MRGLIVVVLCLCTLVVTGAASADECASTGSGGSVLNLGMSCADPGSIHPGSGGEQPVSNTPPFIEYKWVSACQDGTSSAPGDLVLDCASARVCPDPAERLWRLWGRAPGVGWTSLGGQCFGRPPGPADTPRPPEIGPGDVLTALRRIGLPALEAKTQPADKTLVNFETIFYAEPETFARTISLLGQRVEVEATPSTYTWHHGDGTSSQTSTPGARYPAQDVIHEYTDAHVTVTPSVDVTYTARFRVNGGAWQDIPETVTISGPAGSLRIAEATAVLSGDYG